MKRVNVVLVIILVACFMFSAVGCGTSGKTATNSTAAASAGTASSSESTAAAEALKPVTLSWYMIGDNQPDEQMVFDAASKYAKEKINADVKFTVFSFGDYDQKMQVKISSAEKFDLCFTAIWANNYFANVAKGNFKDITDLVPKYAPKKYAALPKFVWDGLKVKGKLYTCITGYVAWQDAIFMDKATTDSIGVDPKSVKSLKDLTPIFAKVKEKFPDMIPYVLAKNSNFPLGQLNLEFVSGNKMPAVIKRDSSGSPKVTNIFDEPTYLEYLDLAREWYKAGYINNDAATLPENWTLFSAGKSFSNLDACYYPGKEIEWQPKYNNQPMYAAVIGTPYIPADSILTCGNAVSVNSDNPERAVMLMELANTDRAFFRLLGQGIEGVHYKDIGNNFVELMPDTKYNPNNNWAWGDLDRNGYQLKGTPEGMLDGKARSGVEAKPSPALGFTLDYTPIKTEIAQITSVCNEYFDLILTGSVDPKVKVPEVNEKLKKAGLDKYLAEVQKQLDEWYAAKGK